MQRVCCVECTLLIIRRDLRSRDAGAGSLKSQCELARRCMGIATEAPAETRACACCGRNPHLACDDLEAPLATEVVLRKGAVAPAASESVALIRLEIHHGIHPFSSSRNSLEQPLPLGCWGDDSLCTRFHFCRTSILFTPLMSCGGKVFQNLFEIHRAGVAWRVPSIASAWQKLCEDWLVERRIQEN